MSYFIYICSLNGIDTVNSVTSTGFVICLNKYYPLLPGRFSFRRLTNHAIIGWVARINRMSISLRSVCIYKQK